MNFNELVDFELWGNTGVEYAKMLAVFVGLLVLFKIFSSIILLKMRKASEQTETDVDDFLVALVRHIRPPFYAMVAFYVAVQFLALNKIAADIIFGVFMITVVVQVVVVLQKVIDYIIKKRLLRPGDKADPDKEAIVRLAGNLSKAALWIFGGLLVLSNLGINVTSLVAGLGIGGIAIAFAVKGVLEDIFASFSIFVDKPFRIGDYVGISDKEQGTVEKIGIKSTRLRTREGHELVMANKMLTDKALTNYRSVKSAGERKIFVVLGVAYETSSEKLKQIPKILTEIIEKNPNTQPVRVVFKAYAESSLDFEMVYSIDMKKDISRFKVQSDINYEIFEAFQREGIEFAYPTQTLYVNKKE